MPPTVHASYAVIPDNTDHRNTPLHQELHFCYHPYSAAFLSWDPQQNSFGVQNKTLLQMSIRSSPATDNKIKFTLSFIYFFSNSGWTIAEYSILKKHHCLSHCFVSDGRFYFRFSFFLILYFFLTFVLFSIYFFFCIPYLKRNRKKQC